MKRSETVCDICGKARVKHPPILYGYNSAYYVCFDCYEEIGITINDMIEGIKEAYENEQI